MHQIIVKFGSLRDSSCWMSCVGQFQPAILVPGFGASAASFCGIVTQLEKNQGCSTQPGGGAVAGAGACFGKPDLVAFRLELVGFSTVGWEMS